MVRFFNPGGHNWGAENLDGYGICQIVVAVIYSLGFYGLCAYVWLLRNHPAIKMRKIPLALLSVLILHVYLFMVFMVYPMNGAFPCSVEFWIMSIYLPLGIGLFQAQNQQLLTVSDEQSQILNTVEQYKPVFPGYGKGLGGPKYWFWRFKLWWQTSSSSSANYEGLVLGGITAQFALSLFIYCLSRKFNVYGILGNQAFDGMCRRGWEWAPSIVWQLVWNYILGPCLLWKMRMIHDIYQWRLQTTLAIVAGLPGTPLWLTAVYTDSFASINKWWIPAMWFVPGLITMELTTLLFPIMQVRKYKKNARETQQALAAFDHKVDLKQRSLGSARSSVTQSTNSKKGKMFSMESLNECLASNYDGLQIYASGLELNGENIVFLTKVLQFQKQWHSTFSRAKTFSGALKMMFPAALSIYIQLIHAATAVYPINIESPIYAKLDSIFSTAVALMASSRRGSEILIPVGNCAATPWDVATPETPDSTTDGFPMHSMPASRTNSGDNESTENLTRRLCDDRSEELEDPFANFMVPRNFDDHVFDAAFNSIKYMIWTGTWQRYMAWKRTSAAAIATAA